MAIRNSSTSPVNVAALQMRSGSDLQQNLATADAMLGDAAARKCRLAVLPENFAFVGAADADKLAHAEMEGSGPIQAFLSDAAKRHDLCIIAGSLPLKSGQADRCYGASMVFDSRGVMQGCYRKMHLFDVDLPDRNERYRESASMAHGEQPVVVDTVIGKVGLSICYDVRFPELYRQLVDEGATVLSVPAAFTKVTGAAHWEVLLRARAIENLAYVIAPGQQGLHPNGRETFGHSMIIDPWGRIIAQQTSGQAVVVAELDPAVPARLRREFPALQHRRLK